MIGEAANEAVCRSTRVLQNVCVCPFFRSHTKPPESSASKDLPEYPSATHTHTRARHHTAGARPVPASLLSSTAGSCGTHGMRERETVHKQAHTHTHTHTHTMILIIQNRLLCLSGNICVLFEHKSESRDVDGLINKASGRRQLERRCIASAGLCAAATYCTQAAACVCGRRPPDLWCCVPRGARTSQRGALPSNSFMYTDVRPSPSSSSM